MMPAHLLTAANFPLIPCSDRAIDLKMFSLEHQDDALVLACCGLFEVESIMQSETDVCTIDLVQTKAPDCKLIDVVFGG